MASTADPPAHVQKSGGSVVGITVGVGVPIILVIATAVIVLILVLIYLNYRSKQSKLDDYQPVPTEDISTLPAENVALPKKSSAGSSALPYPVKLTRPARVHIDDPQPPATFVQAMQLDSSGGTGYQFKEPQPLSAHALQQYDHRSGKKRDGKQVHLHSAEPTDSSDQESNSRWERRVPGQASPRGSPSMPGRKFSGPVIPFDYENQPKLPEICFRLSYREQSNALVIIVERVAYLPYRGDGTTMDAYVRLFFIPKLSELPQRKTSKTRTQRGTSPVFDEALTYEAMTQEELINSTLHVEVLDYRSYGKHHILGQGDLPLIQVKFEDGEASITLPLHLPKVCVCVCVSGCVFVEEDCIAMLGQSPYQTESRKKSHRFRKSSLCPRSEGDVLSSAQSPY